MSESLTANVLLVDLSTVAARGDELSHWVDAGCPARSRWRWTAEEGSA